MTKSVIGRALAVCREAEEQFPSSAPVMAVSLTGSDQTLLAVASDRNVYRNQWSDAVGKWMGWAELANDRFINAKFNAQTSISAIRRRPDHIDLFAVDIHGQVRAASFETDSGWSGWETIGR